MNKKIENINIKVVYYNPDNNDNIVIYDVKNGIANKDKYKKPFGWKAERIMEFESNFSGKIKFNCKTKWIFLALNGTHLTEDEYEINYGYNKIVTKLNIIGMKDGKLIKKSMLATLKSSITFLDELNNSLFCYEVKYKVAKV